MKAKDLIKLLETVDPEAEIVTPGLDESFAASDFTLEPIGILFNEGYGSPSLAPHDTCKRGEEGSVPGYLLNGDW